MLLLLIALVLEHACTPEERAQGLMYREKLEENHGMTFNYEEPQILGFWSENCLIDLDVAFLSSEKVIQEIHTLKCHPLTIIYSKTPMQYALEMKGGWFAENGVGIGDRVHWVTHKPGGHITRSKRAAD